jgi:H+/Cl- antiporter ClcA/CBS domain-containing protein
MHPPDPVPPVDARVVLLSCVAIGIGATASLAASVLTALIGLVTNLAFYGRLSTRFTSPAHHHLGLLVVGIPVVGGAVVGLMARFGSKAIRGHGIPEAMEQILVNESRIPARVAFLKPLSAAVSIGTGGPFGAEGPIIATGGALGSVIGQLLGTSSGERKTLLAAGAAAGMAATFGSPVSAVLLAIELLLFEFRPRSLVPVALAAATAAVLRGVLAGAEPVFVMPEVALPGPGALAAYVGLGVAVGLAAAAVTRAVYAAEDGFARLPIHWMWWPALGGLVIGLVAWVAPRTLGVGYDNIEDIIAGRMAIGAATALCGWKLISWAISLGSGTSGGTLAPLFTIGGGLGAALGAGLAAVLPRAGVDVRVAALVGMAALFAGSSRAMLTSVVFAFETTRQPAALLPLLAGCSASYLVSLLVMRHSIMTEKIERRGVRAIGEYDADLLLRVLVRECASPAVVTLSADRLLAEVRAWMGSGAPGSDHQGFPVVDEAGHLVGVLTRRDLLDPQLGALRVREVIRRPPAVIFDDSTVRDAVEHMVVAGVGRLPVVTRADPRRPIGILTRSDVLAVHRRRIEERRTSPGALGLWPWPPLRRKAG